MVWLAFGFRTVFVGCCLLVWMCWILWLVFVLRCFSLGFVLKFGLVCGGLFVGFMI